MSNLTPEQIKAWRHDPVTQAVFSKLAEVTKEQRNESIYCPGMESGDYALRACYSEAFVEGANAFADAYGGLEWEHGDMRDE